MFWLFTSLIFWKVSLNSKAIYFTHNLNHFIILNVDLITFISYFIQKIFILSINLFAFCCHYIQFIFYNILIIWFISFFCCCQRSRFILIFLQRGLLCRSTILVTRVRSLLNILFCKAFLRCICDCIHSV